MNQYLLLFRNSSAENEYLISAEDMAKELPKWESWIGQIAMQGKLISTAPIHYTGEVVDVNGRIESPYKESNSIMISGFLICKSDRYEEVVSWSKSCPILNHPESSVEIRQINPFSIQ